MDFSEALKALKDGKHLTRKGWNDKGMFIYLTKGFSIQCDELKPETRNHVESFIGYAGIDSVWINGHIDMVAADGSIVIGWLASQTDMLANDWEIV